MQDTDTLNQILQQLTRLADVSEARLADTRRAVDGDIDWSAIAFRWRDDGRLQAVPSPSLLPLDRLHGIDTQKQRLVANTRQFVAGRPSNNALLWGARGTGKSSLVRALLHAFADDGLRMVEVPAHRLVDLPDLVQTLAERDERFIVFSDDLSFEAGDGSYKALKAVLDGSLSAAPDNVVIYATSNRRHLLPEYQSENQAAQVVDGEIHHGEAVEEKVSLSERFGLWLSFYPFDQVNYLAIAARHLAAHGIEADIGVDSPWERAALQWALARGNRSGRTAEQFARDWAGRDTPAS
ncbi:ATP-binding protein [Salinisphaera sp. Q1T1-3]|uniref:ATP-binding protein n=1 Tax=Salinisphaera sp. Q1T1-3 TaxID=2321229 RepID=UPI000E70DC91|nr:ATP-binding protein [Salinisphaera sp. Q1T1-3]RJS94464.1 ATP-binding protein [Salinisphaera sp. Q1T1-3]